MSCDADAEVGQPVITWPPKRSYDSALIEFDWHNFLANKPKRSTKYSLGTMVRLPRDPDGSRVTGFQYECTSAGVTSNVEPRWPTTLNGTVTDGTVVWTARAMADTSMRTTVSSQVMVPPSGITLASESLDDFRYRAVASGGADDEDYQIKHRIECANGEKKEAVGILPVRD